MAQARGRRGPYKKSLARREEIAAAVLGIVDADGHDAVTTARVAEAAGIPEPSVLYHFPTKDHLLVAALSRADDELAREVGVDAADIALDIDAMRARGVGAQWRSPHRARLDALLRSLAMNPEHPARAFIADRNRRALHVWTAMIERRQRDGLADPAIDPHRAAWQVIALLEGFSAFALGDEVEDAVGPEAMGELLADAVLALLGGPRSGA